MLYWIAEQLGFPGVLNLIRYLTFRSGAAIITALVIGLVIGPKFIGWLRVRQGKGQPIRLDGPQTHLAKRGTPTMGGLMILTAMVLSVLLWMDLRSIYIWACIFVTLGFGAIGFLDDYDKVTKASHKGLSGRARLLVEFAIAGLATVLIVSRNGTELYLPFWSGGAIDLGYFYYVFAAFVIVSFGNSVNLTDGLDGLATMPVVVACMAFMLIAYIVGRADYAHPACAGGGRPRDPVRRDRGGVPRLPVVQRAAGGGVHGRHGVAGARRHHRRDRGDDASRDRVGDHRRPVRGGGGVRHHPGLLLQAHRHAFLPHGADPPSFRAAGLA
jgi:hypothetical protein